MNQSQLLASCRSVATVVEVKRIANEPLDFRICRRAAIFVCSQRACEFVLIRLVDQCADLRLSIGQKIVRQQRLQILVSGKFPLRTGWLFEDCSRGVQVLFRIDLRAATQPHAYHHNQSEHGDQHKDIVKEAGDG